MGFLLEKLGHRGGAVEGLDFVPMISLSSLPIFHKASSEYDLCKSGLSFHHVRYEGQTQGVRLSGRYAYSLIHTTVTREIT